MHGAIQMETDTLEVRYDMEEREEIDKIDERDEIDKSDDMSNT